MNGLYFTSKPVFYAIFEILWVLTTSRVLLLKILGSGIFSVVTPDMKTCFINGNFAAFALISAHFFA